MNIPVKEEHFDNLRFKKDVEQRKSEGASWGDYYLKEWQQSCLTFPIDKEESDKVESQIWNDHEEWSAYDIKKEAEVSGIQVTCIEIIEGVARFVDKQNEMSDSIRYPLFSHMMCEHGLVLLDSEIDEIISIVNKIQST